MADSADPGDRPLMGLRALGNLSNGRDFIPGRGEKIGIVAVLERILLLIKHHKTISIVHAYSS